MTRNTASPENPAAERAQQAARRALARALGLVAAAMAIDWRGGALANATRFVLRGGRIVRIDKSGAVFDCHWGKSLRAYHITEGTTILEFGSLQTLRLAAERGTPLGFAARLSLADLHLQQTVWLLAGRRRAGRWIAERVGVAVR